MRYFTLIFIFNSLVFSQYRNTEKVDTLEKYSNQIDNYKIKLSDNYIINSKVLLSSSKSSKFLIMLAGDSGNMSYLYDIGYEISLSLDVNIIFYDYRGTGLNEPYDFGNIQISSKHIHDLKELIKFYNNKLENPIFYLNGISLGGILALNQYENPLVAGVFIDSAPLNFENFVNDLNLKVDNLNSFYSNLKDIPKLNEKSIYIMHTLDDGQININYVFANPKSKINIEFLFVNNSNHGAIYNTHFDEYISFIGLMVKD